MKSMAQDRYGPPDRVLELRDVERPVPEDSEEAFRYLEAGHARGKVVIAVAGADA